MTISVDTHNKQEEQVLIAFIDSLKYDYQTEEEDIFLTDTQKAEILAWDKDSKEGRTTVRDRNEIKKEMGRVYR